MQDEKENGLIFFDELLRLRRKIAKLEKTKNDLSPDKLALLKGHVELAQQVDERTAELALANYRLKCRLEESELIEAELRESEEKYRNLFENSPVGLAITDDNGHVIIFNNALLRPGGYSLEDMAGLNITEFYYNPEQRTRILAIAHRQGFVNEAEVKFKRKDGTVYDILLSARPLLIKGESCWHAMVQDVTDRKRAEWALRDSEQRMAQIIDFLPDATFAVDVDGKVIAWNRAIEGLTGVKGEEMLGKGNYEYSLPFYHTRRPILIDLVLRPEEKLEKYYYFVCREKDRVIVETKVTVPVNNQKLWLWGIASPIYDQAGNRVGAIESIRNITKQKEAEQTLHKSSAQIHNLNRQLLKAQETERQNISRYLHDRLANDLSVVKLGCENLFYNQPEVPGEIRKKVSEFCAILMEAISIVRDISHDLSPAGLDKLGLDRTVFRYCKDFSEKTGLIVDFASVGIESLTLDFDTKINLYRVIQEALNNINKHAEAENATVRLIASSSNIILRIEDDGNGFDPERRLAATVEEKRMGLQSMQERVRLLGGTFKIHSQPGAGTRIFIEIPFDESAV
jgi:PAS domain S-box-containing protein